MLKYDEHLDLRILQISLEFMHRTGKGNNNPCTRFSVKGLKRAWCWPHLCNFPAVRRSLCHNANATADDDFIKDRWTARIRLASENENTRLRDSTK